MRKLLPIFPLILTPMAFAHPPSDCIATATPAEIHTDAGMVTAELEPISSEIEESLVAINEVEIKVHEPALKDPTKMDKLLTWVNNFSEAFKEKYNSLMEEEKVVTEE